MGCGSLIFFSTFLPTHHRIPLLFQLLGVGKSTLQRLSLTEKMTPVQIIQSNLTEKVGLQRIIFNIFELTTTEAMSSYELRPICQNWGSFPRALFRNRSR